MNRIFLEYCATRISNRTFKSFFAGNLCKVDTEVEVLIDKTDVITANFSEGDRINRTIAIYNSSFFRRSKEDVISEIRFTISEKRGGVLPQWGHI